MGNIASIIQNINITMPRVMSCFFNCRSSGIADSEKIVSKLIERVDKMVEANTLLKNKELISLVLLKIMDAYDTNYGRVSIIKRDTKKIVVVANICMPEDTSLIDITKFPITHLSKLIGFIELGGSDIDYPSNFGNKINVLSDLIETLI